MKLSQDSLVFARKHIEAYYDSDFFAKPFEFDAIRTQWDEACEYLATTDIDDLSTEVPLLGIVPKPYGGFRVVHQLDPLNTLAYVALTFHVAESIEQARIKSSEGVACSYRIKVDPSGSFFDSGNGYGMFFKRSESLAEEYRYVLTTDISDFYNQIYLHRLQNNIEYCGKGLADISRKIERFLTKINNSVSKGVPVGPAPSIIMAEAVLIDVDKFVRDECADFTRYVDDFRIFSNSKSDLERLLHDLTEYLYANHRLTLATSKTQIMETEVFVSEHLLTSQTIERGAIHTALGEQEIRLDSYGGFIEDLPDSEVLPKNVKIKMQAGVFKSMIEAIVSHGHLNVGAARHLLRRARKLRSRAIVPYLLDNFEFFVPVVRDVILYLLVVTNRRMVEHEEKRFRRILQSNVATLPYVAYWLQYYFASESGFHNLSFVKSYFRSVKNIRLQAILARNAEEIHWIRTHKGKLSNCSAWERRGIMFSSLALSRDERSKWMDGIAKTSENLMERLLAQHLRSIA